MLAVLRAYWWAFQSWLLPRPWEIEPRAYEPRAVSISVRSRAGGPVEVIYEKQGQTYCWRYWPYSYASALREPGRMAAKGGEFNFQDAAFVTAAMRGEKLAREARERANAV